MKSTEKEVVAQTLAPHTFDSLREALLDLGIRKEDIVLVHSSLSKLGWIVGGAETVVQALKSVAGTIVMPAQSGANSEPSYWQDPPVPASWWPRIRATMPPFSRTSPVRAMGRVVEHFLMDPAVVRSAHPQVSFAAWGTHAETIVERHGLDFGLGADSPLQTLYAREAKVLLLGVDYGNCTCLHWSEAHLSSTPLVRQGASVLVDGKRVWKTFDEYDYDDSDFARLGMDYERQGGFVVKNELGRVVPMRDLCDFGVQWLRKHRTFENFSLDH
ncbi:aminoglycoside N(3)-acetyltransferase [uncultured Dubosiella sp.]|uniref:aminoglycoside N(3)-acetyltransferase n=2 Tax=uncultured Dubosiella sp. TaxID=1937011 RepID=UPI00273184EC|nr:AAC(3) family N-acetyltransferase [uncultured Dubosiella sp.]